MATPLLGLYTPGDNADAGNWGHNWNNGGSTILDTLLAGVQAITLASGTVNLTLAQANSQMLSLSGTLLANVTITNGGNLWNGIRCVENLTTGAFTVTLSQNGTVNVPQGRRCLVFLDTTFGPRLISAVTSTGTSDIPTGTISPFYQAAAPSGWTISATLNDYGMRIVSANGGVVSGGTQPYSTVFAQITTGGYSLLVGDIPSHTHPFTGVVLVASPPNTLGYTTTGAFSAAVGVVGAAGSGNAHSHPFNITVQTADFILATKN